MCINCLIHSGWFLVPFSLHTYPDIGVMFRKKGAHLKVKHIRLSFERQGSAIRQILRKLLR